MEVVRSEDYMALRLDHGEDILASISGAVKNETSTLMITTGLGMISDFELGYFDRGRYITKTFDEPHELLALQGSVAVGGEPRIHIHATVAAPDHKVFGGHLLRGKVWMSNEIAMLRLDGQRSERVFDPEKKVAVLHLK